MNPSGGRSRRKEKRVPFKEFVLINGALRAKAIDISEGGIYVHTGRSFKPGTDVYVSFLLKYVEFETKARVTFSHEGVGMGLMFEDLPAQKKSVIRKYVSEMGEGGQDEEAHKKRVAIIYERAPLTMHKSELVLSGFTVFEVEQKPGVLSKLIECVPVDVIVLAVDMAKSEDFKLLSLLMESADFNHIPIIVLSGNAQAEVAHKVLAYGAREFLSRPVTSPKKLVNLLTNVIERK